VGDVRNLIFLSYAKVSPTFRDNFVCAVFMHLFLFPFTEIILFMSQDVPDVTHFFIKMSQFQKPVVIPVKVGHAVKRETLSSILVLFWTPAFAGVTLLNRLGIGSHDYCKFKHRRKHPSALLLSPLVVAAASDWIAWELLKTAPPTVSEILSSTTDTLSSPRFPST